MTFAFGLAPTCALFLTVVSLAASLAGCSGTGPRGRDLIAAGSQEDAPFALVDITDQTLDVVSDWRRPSFSATYGDYRGPQAQKVQVGDAVQVNIWETGSGGLYSAPAGDHSVAQGTRNSSIPEQVIARDGTINVPYAGRLRVAGLTTPEIERMIVKGLQGKTPDPQAMVTLTKNVSQSVTVAGDVANGAIVPLNPNGDRILDVIAQAGGIKAPVHEAFITLSRDGTSLSVPMQAILANTKENIYVRPRDIVTVYRAPQSFTAVGATGRNAVVPFDAGGITLEEAMGKAGGLLDERSDPTGVFVLRYEPVRLARQYPNISPRLVENGNVVPVVYRLDVSNPISLFRARRFAMRDKDILYVSTAPLTEIEKVFRVIGTLASPALSTYYYTSR